MRLQVRNVIEDGFLSWSQLALQLHNGRCRMTPSLSLKLTRYGTPHNSNVTPDRSSCRALDHLRAVLGHRCGLTRIHPGHSALPFVRAVMSPFLSDRRISAAQRRQ